MFSEFFKHFWKNGHFPKNIINDETQKLQKQKNRKKNKKKSRKTKQKYIFQKNIYKKRAECRKI